MKRPTMLWGVAALAVLVVALVAWAVLRPAPLRDTLPAAEMPLQAPEALPPAEPPALPAAPVEEGEYPAVVDEASLDPEAIASLRGAREFGDPRTPPIARSEPQERASAEELADPEKYAEYEARQERKLKRAYVIESEQYLKQLRDDLDQGRAMGVPADEIAKVEEKVRRIEAMRAQLLEADPALLDGQETPTP